MYHHLSSQFFFTLAIMIRDDKQIKLNDKNPFCYKTHVKELSFCCYEKRCKLSQYGAYR